PNLGARELANWCQQKFNFKPEPEVLAKMEPDEATEHIVEQAQAAYRQREVQYPVQFILELVFQGAQQDQQWAANQLCAFANQRYQLGWTPEEVVKLSGQQIHEKLTA